MGKNELDWPSVFSEEKKKVKSVSQGGAGETQEHYRLCGNKGSQS